MVKEHTLMGWAQLGGGILAFLLVLFMQGVDLKWPVLLFALIFIAMGYQHIASKR